ncbi:YczE/YyaS/YitT family protein [Streptomyces bathyalis]|nr:hypothetical protein [Streptomyces bathyalis]
MSRPSRPSGTGGHIGRRLVQLYAGLLLYGGSIGLMVESGLGLPPWDVLHQGLARHTGLSIGTASVVAGAVVLLLWVPIRQRPGLGTVSNVVLVGMAMDGTIWLTPTPDALALRIPGLALAVVLNGVATGLYISARFGPGPRDGLMTGLHRVTGRSVRLVRTGIEATVLVSGLLLGGTAGVGTVVYALGIGPLSQLFLRVFAVPAAQPESADGSPSTGTGASHVVARGTVGRDEDAAGGRRRAWWRGGAILRR